MSSPKGAKLPPYTPPPSVAHELGVMFGFIGLMIVVMGTYWVVWQGMLCFTPLLLLCGFLE
jgi:hypothetical protein